ncbi:MAG: FG-GAP-like repeat-containing protein [candidate division KSB1 bacterium]|nr:FG-GAP-like repeat-containing protein [candidate division KSB1 bacterium]MDZ7335869.1 FG-GAP-like repeat-containing protein [candidate division KSB1 bacterium]MDZ7398935.1 FG-GAP-like repeat-containing protein [candidate division KSB1 bacterium]
MNWQPNWARVGIATSLLVILLTSLLQAQDPFVQITFSWEKVMASRGVSWADYDNDGYPDFYVSNGVTGYKQVNFLYHNNGDGTFTRVMTGPPVEDQYVTYGSSWGDYDNDGDLDLYVAVTTGTYDDPVINNCLYVNNGDGTFTKNTTAGPPVNERESTCAVGWGDYDNDGFLDLFIKNGTYPKQPNSLYRSNGDGTFTEIVGIPLVGNENATLVSRFAWGDYDNDGDPDLAIAGGDGENNAIWRNDGNNTFTKLVNQNGMSIIQGSYSSAPCWGDYDNDGDLDLFMSNYGKNGPAKNFLYRNDGNDVFTKIVDGDIVNEEKCSLGCAWGDIDNDGDLDLFVGNDIFFKNSLFINNGDGTFTKDTTSVVTDSSFTYGAAFADFNKDGFIDLFICREAKNILYQNNGPNNGNTNHWINLQCTGTNSNRAGIGAKVRVKATIDGQVRWQMREISAQNGYGSHDDLRAHFGLGDATLIDELIIEWPSGLVQTLTSVAVDQFLTIIESDQSEMIKITAPNGGEQFQAGNAHEITWQSHNISGTVKIEFSTDGGATWNLIADGEPDDGSYSWQVPHAPSENCRIRITDSDGSPFDVSDNPFTILPIMHVLTISVNPAETGTTDPSIGEHSYALGTVVTLIATSAEGYEFVNWSGDVADPNNDTTSVLIDGDKMVTANFKDSTTYLIIATPNGGEDWEVSSLHDITWSSNKTSGKVTIEFSADSAATWTVVADTTEDDGLFSWTIPNSLSNKCLVRVSDVDGHPTDISDTLFTISMPPFITVQSPNGGEDWEVGSVQQITWSSNKTSGTVKIEFSSDSAATWIDIVASTEDDGLFEWTIPSTPSARCLVRVTDSDGDPNDVSDAVFTISQVPFISLVSPNGGEDWKVGSVHDISWSSNKTSGKVTIEFSADSAVTWILVADTTEDDGIFSWTIPNSISSKCLVRVSDVDGDPVDVSNAVFSISPQSFQLKMVADPPEGGATEPAVGDHSFSDGSIVRVIAFPASGYVFLNWTGDVADPNNDTTTVTMNADKIVTAHFAAVPAAIADLRASVQGSHILLEWSSVDGATSYHVYRDTSYNFIPDRDHGSNRIATGITDEDPGTEGVQWTDTGHGAQIVGDVNRNYFYRVTAVSSVESEPSNLASEFDYQLVTTARTDINEIAVIMNTLKGRQPIRNAEELAQAIPYCTDVYYWDAAVQGIVGHVKGLPFNNFNVVPGYPYMINVTKDTVWTVAGSYADTSFHLITTSKTDINHIAVPLSKNYLTNAEQLGQDIPNCTDVYAWDAVNQGLIGHVVGLPFANFDVSVGHSYYVNVTADTVWPAPEKTAATSLLLSASGKSSKAVAKEVSKSGRAVPHTVYGRLIYPQDKTIRSEDLELCAWLAGHEGEVEAANPAGSGCDGEFWWVSVSSISPAWAVGDTLQIAIREKSGSYVGTTFVVLSDAGSDNAGVLRLDRASIAASAASTSLPEQFVLNQNYPNPFNPATLISFQLPEARTVTLKVFNLLGDEIRTLLNEKKQAGYHQISWDGKNDSGQEMPSGIYLIKIEAGEFRAYRKMVKIR